MINIDQERKNAWIRQLRVDWKNANYAHFNSIMQVPNLTIFSSKNCMGRWEGGIKRTLGLSDVLINTCSWQYVQEILYHEMAHQYVDEILMITDQPPHGETFRKICSENAFNYRASGDLQDWIEKKNIKKSDLPYQKVFNKIQKLLSLAQSSYQAEAELAMAKAHELLLKYNLHLEEIEFQRNYFYKQIGEVGRKNPIKSLIGSILGRFFFVEILWVFGYEQQKEKQGRVLEIYGTRENIEMAEYVHDFLHNAIGDLWHAFKQQKSISGNKHRRSFIYGLLNGFYQKLEGKAAECETKSLIWRGDSFLKDYFRRKNPKISHKTYRYSKSSHQIYQEGVQRGKSLIIHKGIKGNNAEGKCRKKISLQFS